MKQPLEIARLGLLDVCHEWRMSLCMILAVAAIATPLLLFFGLKYGVVETLRQRLLANPATMEIIPLSEKRLTQDWFNHICQNPAISFVVPHTRRLAAQAEFSISAGAAKKMLDLAPTYENDPLLANFGVPTPDINECVLSAQAYARLNAHVGSKLFCWVSRDRGQVKVKRTFLVVGVLPEMAGNVPCVYLSLQSLEQIEHFKDGFAVPALGWPGRDPLAYPVLSQAILASKNPLDAIGQALLVQSTGFAKIKSLGPDFNLKDHLYLPKNYHLYLLEALGNQADSRDIETVLDRLRGTDFFLYPYAPNLKFKLTGSNGVVEISPLAYPLNRKLPNLDLQDNAALLGHDLTDFSNKPSPRVIWLNPKLKEKIGSEITIVASYNSKTASIDASADPNSVSFQAKCFYLPKALAQKETDLGISYGYVLPSLLGQLELLAKRPLIEGQTADGQKAFLLGRRGYTGCRMYAASLENVRLVKQLLEDEGITVSTKADRIEEVLALDKYLGLLFWIIAIASLLGGMGCLISNVYANVERKRKELAVLRLIGVHGLSLVAFPLTHALVLTLSGLILSLVLFHSLAFTINLFFASHLQSGEIFCQLTFAHQLQALGLGLVLSVLTGILASRRLAKIDPAESLRDE